VTLPAAQRLLDLDGRVTELAVAVAPGYRSDEVAERLRAALGPDFEVFGWEQLIPEIADVNMRQRQVLGVVAALLMTLVVFGIVNTMLMCVRERIREIGTMTALGMRPSQVLALFIEEALLIGMVGGAGGFAIGVAVSAFLGRIGIPLGSTSPLLADGLRPAFDLGYAVFVMGGSALVAAAAGFAPAYKAARLKPVDALAIS
jgi:ABC-type lipoprotein release transport system permease subunit